MQAFADAIGSGSMANLQALNLSGNQIGDVGMTEFSRAIASGSMGVLKYLSLHQNQIGDAGMTGLRGRDSQRVIGADSSPSGWEQHH